MRRKNATGQRRYCHAVVSSCAIKHFYFQKLARLINHVRIYGSNVAEGFSAFQRWSCYRFGSHSLGIRCAFRSHRFEVIIKSTSLNIKFFRRSYVDWRLIFIALFYSGVVFMDKYFHNWSSKIAVYLRPLKDIPDTPLPGAKNPRSVI